MTKAELWLHDKFVVEWFDLLGNKRTIENYRREFPRFLEFVRETTEYKTPNAIIESRLKQLATTDLNVKRFWESVGIKYMHSLEAKDLRLNTVRSYLRTMLSFFSKNHLPLVYSRGELLGAIEPSEKDKVIKEWIPSNEDVRVLYRMANSSRDRALLLMLYQSGFSEVDVSQMQIADFPLYDSNGNWSLKLNEDLYHARLREKTNILQQTCISRECLEEIRIMLQQRGFPKEGSLFVSFRDKPLDVREMNMAIKAIVERAFNGKAKEWKTKHLRDAYMNALEKAKITQEIKDAMVGHQRAGARKEYGIAEDTIKTLYVDGFKFLTINGYGSQSRKIEELEVKFTEQLKAMTEIMTQLRTENTDLKARLGDNTETLKRMTTDIDVIQKKLKIKPKPLDKLN